MPEGGAGVTAFAVMFFGAPGSGKGTVGRLVGLDLGIPHISTGDLLRDRVSRDDDFGRRIQDLIGVGRLVPDEMVNEMVRTRIDSEDCAGGFLLDGYPRTIEQAAVLYRLLSARGTAAVVIHLKVDYDIIIKRLAGRRTCPSCGAVYNVNSNPPARDGVCDRDGSPVITREDDREDVILARLEAYDRMTRPLENYFKQSVGRLHEIDGSAGPPPVIAAEAAKLVRSEQVRKMAKGSGA